MTLHTFLYLFSSFIIIYGQWNTKDIDKLLRCVFTILQMYFFGYVQDSYIYYCIIYCMEKFSRKYQGKIIISVVLNMNQVTETTL